MRIFVTGATGFIGGALTERLIAGGHSVVAWARSPDKARARLGERVEIAAATDLDGALVAAIDGCDAIVNLAGESIFNGRWSESRKKILIESRLSVTNGVVAAIAKAKRPPKVLVSASGINYYGNLRREVLDEGSSAGDGFLADLCNRWENAARAAESTGVRVAILRISPVLGKGGGAMAQMLPVFKLGAGGKLGSGDQPFPFIHLDDLILMLVTAATDDRWRGTFNATAPAAITNKVLTAELGRALHRPTIFSVPAFAMKLMLGEGADVVLGGLNALPAHAEQLGFQFRHATIRSALEAVTTP